MDNLLDIDFDGALPASVSSVNETTSPSLSPAPVQPQSNLDDLLGLAEGAPGKGINGLEDLDIGSSKEPKKDGNEDIMSLF